MTVRKKQGILEYFWEQFHVTLQWLIAGIFEAVYIIVWVIIQWWVNESIIARFTVAGVDKITLNIVQWIFSISTLSPIILDLIKNQVVMIVRTYREIRKQIKKHDDDNANI